MISRDDINGQPGVRSPPDGERVKKGIAAARRRVQEIAEHDEPRQLILLEQASEPLEVIDSRAARQGDPRTAKDIVLAEVRVRYDERAATRPDHRPLR